MTLNMNLIIVILITILAANTALKVAVETTGSPKYSEPHFRESENVVKAAQMLQDIPASEADDSQKCSPNFAWSPRGWMNASTGSIKSWTADITCRTFAQRNATEINKGVTVTLYSDTQAWLHAQPRHVSLQNLSIFSCSKSVLHGGEIRVESVGPFVTMGNYSWTAFGWNDIATMSDILASHPEGMHLVKLSTLTVDHDGTIIKNPPLHHHHVHLSVGKNPFLRNMSKCIFELDASECAGIYFASQDLFMTHGDSQCTELEGDVGCMHHILPTGYAYTLDEPMSINGEINDIRPGGSEELVWYVKIAMQWAPKTKKLRTLSQITTAAPFPYQDFWGFDVAVSSTGTWDSPIDRDHIMWYTMEIPWGVKILNVWQHSHGANFAEAFLFEGSPDSLGLPPKRDSPWIPTYPSDLGFYSLEAVRHELLQRVGKTNWGNGMFSLPPKLRVHVRPQFEKQAGYKYPFDRFATTCFLPWESQGRLYTIVGLYRRKPYDQSTLGTLNTQHLSFHFLFDANRTSSLGKPLEPLGFVRSLMSGGVVSPENMNPINGTDEEVQSWADKHLHAIFH